MFDELCKIVDPNLSPSNNNNNNRNSNESIQPPPMQTSWIKKGKSTVIVMVGLQGEENDNDDAHNNR